MRWTESKGNGYTVPITAYYWVHVDTESPLYEAEDEAWDMLDGVLKELDEEYEIYETVESYVGLKCYSFKLRVDFKIYVVAFDADVAFDIAETLIDEISLPNNIDYIGTEQRMLVEEEEPVYIIHGDDV